MDYAEYHITLPEPCREPLIAAMFSAGALGVIEQTERIVVYFPASVPRRLVMAHIDVFRELLGRSSQRTPIIVKEAVIADQDWNISWKQGFRSIAVGQRFTVLPPWERPPAGRIPLTIDPGMAFGTGHHETTRSCLVLMERYASSVEPKRFLDLGTGTGLLAIAAWKLGFQHIDAVDHDDQAVAAARRNLALNEAKGIDLRCGGVTTAGSDYAMITANLLSETLVTLAPEIAVRLATQGVAILSGILQGQEDEVIAAMERQGMVCKERLEEGKWISLVMQR